MRDWLLRLLLLCVIAGLCGRVFGLDHVHHCHDEDGAGKPAAVHEIQPGHEHGHGGAKAKAEAQDLASGHESDQGQEKAPGHSEDCPPWPHSHHQHTCCNPLPLAGMEPPLKPMLAPAASWLLWHALEVSLPEAPVLDTDEPPLI